MSGGGFQRSLYFAKHLCEHGFEPIIVCGSTSRVHTPNVNASMASGTSSLKIFRIPPASSNVLWWKIFNSKIYRLFSFSKYHEWWEKSAIAICHQVIESEKINLIYVSCCPFASAYIGRKLSHQYSIPWVLDLRDAWALDDLNEYVTYLHYLYERKAMRKCCNSASAVIMNTPTSHEILLKSFPEMRTKQTFCITNGFEDETIGSKSYNEGSPKTGKPLNLVYSGDFLTDLAFETDAQSRKQLGFVKVGIRFFLKTLLLFRPGKPDLICRSPYYLFKALRLLLDENVITAKDIHFTYIGRVSEIEQKLLHDFSLEAIVSFLGYLQFNEAQKLLMQADVSLLFQHKSRINLKVMTIPGKIYDLMAMEKPILSLVPKGDANEIISHSGLGFICDPDDVMGLKTVIIKLITLHKTGGIIVTPERNYIRSFSRKAQTTLLSKVFDKVLSASQNSTK